MSSYWRANKSSGRGNPWKKRETYGTRFPPQVSPASPPLPFGQHIESLDKNDLKATIAEFSENAVIQHVKTVTSFNFLDRKDRTVLIPGKPPKWTPLASPEKLQEDAGEYLRDRNAAFYPTHPWEPAIIASLRADPRLPSKVDIVACASTIGNLLRFVRGEKKEFRILVEKVQDTVFFIRRENSPTELIPNVRGYGHTFPESYTTWEHDVKGSSTHQRMIHYTFGGLRFLLRFGADGYLPEPHVTVTKRGPQPSKNSTSNLDVASLLADISKDLVNTNVSAQTDTSSKLRVEDKGQMVDHRLLFDLKTRSILSRDLDHVAVELPRLWLTRIPNFILAFHTRGLFEDEDIGVMDMTNEVNRWEREHADDLAHLAALIHKIVEAVSSHQDGKIEIVNRGEGPLNLLEQLPGAGEVLSPTLMAQWKDARDLDSEKPKNEAGTGEWDDVEEKDFTACSEACDYCGRCTY